MFDFLRKKLKDAISGISKKIDEEGEEAEEQPEETTETKPEIEERPEEKQKIEEPEIKELPKKSFFSRLKEKFTIRKKFRFLKNLKKVLKR